jgi:DNA uptake protein ComE-like DNA-binding protein
VILLVVLWVMIVLSILGTTYFHLSSLEILTSRNDLDKFQARLLAESALMLAEAVLDEEGALGYHDLNSQWAGAGQLFEVASLGSGVFQIYTDDVFSEEGGTRFGMRDESSRLNLNTASLEMLQNLSLLTSEQAAAIVDWRDTDNTTTPGGAENDYYNELEDPYDCANAPLQSVAEVLRVKGISPTLLYGEDANRDGVLQTAEDDGDENDPPDNGDGELDRGILPYVTTSSYSTNLNAAGEKRLNLNTASNREVRSRLEGRVSKENLRKIVQYRKKKKFESIAQLLTGEGVEKTVEEKSGEEDRDEDEELDKAGSDGEAASAVLSESTQEGALVSFDEFKAIVDDLTITEDEKLPGLINVNTAPREVLVCLPGMTNQLADRIVERRSSDLGSFTTVADLGTVEGVDAEKFGSLLPYITVRSTVFEVLAVGYLPERKAYSSIESKIDLGGEGAKLVYYRVIR